MSRSSYDDKEEWKKNPVIIAAGVIFILAVFAVGLYFFTDELSRGSFSPLCVFSLYLCLLATFHFSEFLMTYLFNYQFLTFDSTLLNHSTAYHVAMTISVIEFWIEAYFLPEMKTIVPIICVGVLFTLIGQVFRSAAMGTAKSNFNHIVQTKKAEEHVLVTHGIYRYFRHPSYAGFWWWSVGTQVLLCNPLCIPAFAWASLQFFLDRIPGEEQFLSRFFKNYAEYKRETWIGIPFFYYRKD